MAVPFLLYPQPENSYWEVYWGRMQTPDFSDNPLQEIHFRLKGSTESLLGGVAVTMQPYDDTIGLTILDTMHRLTNQHMIGRMRKGIWNILGDSPFRVEIDSTTYAAYDGVFRALKGDRRRR